MRRIQSAIALILLVTAPHTGCTAGEDTEETSALSGPYLGLQTPELIPQVFAPGVVSTKKVELNCAFSPDGGELYFTTWNDGQNTLMMMREVDDRWVGPSPVAFSGTYSDVDPFISTDGKALYFSSMRPLEAGGEPKDSDIWWTERSADGEWGEPKPVSGLNTPGRDDYYTSIDESGTLYFSIFEGHGDGADIYRSRPVGENYSEPEAVAEVNTEFNEHDPFVAPDGSYLIFTSLRPGGFGRGDLYISFLAADDSWGEPRNMGESINTAAYDFCAMVSPDGKYLFFTRNEDGNGDIYWVSAEIIEQLKGTETPSSG
jgi:Tol biopolymer transport system component